MDINECGDATIYFVHSEHIGSQMNELEIDNVRFSEAMFIRGEMLTNIKQGHHLATVTFDKGGVMIDVPEIKGPMAAPRFITLVPFSKIKQIEFKA